MGFEHDSVLLHETVDMLDIRPDGIYVDATLGGAGHSSYLLSQLTTGHLYAFDQDEAAHENARLRLKTELETGKVILAKANFKDLKVELARLGIDRIDGILYDLGVSSPQFDESSRGFSYRTTARLDMRMDQSQLLTAYEVVNSYPYEDLVRIFYRYGEEKFSKSIARKIEEVRKVKPIESTTDLVEVIKSALPQKALKSKGHPAKQVFQAIRIEVNDELAVAESSLEQAIDLLKVGGRISVISFHSLEDRLTKNIFKEYSSVEVPKGLPMIPDEMKPKLKLVNRKPIVVSKEELEKNNRAHSAKLRVAEKLHL